MNIPNILTTLRLLMIPVFIHFMLKGQLVAAALIFISAGITDMLDGYIARRYNMITTWGKLADPLADKLMAIAALSVLTLQNKIEFYLLAIVIVKELLMAAGSVASLKLKKRVVGANWYGKLATVIFYFAITLIIFNSPYGQFFVILAVIVTLFAFLMYLIQYLKATPE